jgi:hypothetical protein
MTNVLTSQTAASMLLTEDAEAQKVTGGSKKRRRQGHVRVVELAAIPAWDNICADKH